MPQHESCHPSEERIIAAEVRLDKEIDRRRWKKGIAASKELGQRHIEVFLKRPCNLLLKHLRIALNRNHESAAPGRTAINRGTDLPANRGPSTNCGIRRLSDDFDLGIFVVVRPSKAERGEWIGVRSIHEAERVAAKRRKSPDSNSA